MPKVKQILQNTYQLKQKLSYRAGRETWLAEDLNSSSPQPVIVKLLTFSDRVQWEDLRLFEREAQVLKHLNHHRIPKYRDYFCLDERVLQFGLVQEYIPGKSFKDWLEKGKAFSEEEIRTIAQEILEILIYLHELSPPVLHRDIKPSNLILGQDNNVYLVDFGAVQDKAAKEGATFTVVGTYGYTPLEQFGGRATPSSDLYALGATLIHMLTGLTPAELPQQNGKIIFSDRILVNPGLVRWLEKLIQPNQENRFSNARVALKALEDNNKAIKAIARSQPQDSRIKLNKTSNRLEIKIPSRGALFDFKNLRIPVYKLAFSFENYIAGGFGGLVILIIVWLWWLLVVLPVASLTYLVSWIWWRLFTFRRIYICLNEQTFNIYWKFLGIFRRQQQGLITTIDSVYVGQISGAKKVFPSVVITVQAQEFIITTFEPSLTQEECDWLVQEMKNWLGFL